jgi:tight adherence protein B
LTGNNLGQRQTLKERLGLFFEQAGVKLLPEQVLLMGVGCFIAAGALGWFVTRSWIAALIMAAICCTLPSLYVFEVRRRRLRRLLTQLPEAFDLISRMMRAGRTFSQAMQTTAEDSAPPLSDEFGFCSDQQQLGMSPNAALRDLARRTGLLEIKIFVLAVSIHRQTGGNFSDLLEKLADIIRARLRTEGMIRAMTAEGRAQIYVLSALPILALLVMSVVSPEHAAQLYARPWLLAVAGTGMATGWFWMNRILNFAY